ncbi:MAG TPA: hypothetical protein VMV81_02600, partial [Phycisphaerae bacterium]|nr:hypothetical protein [Phycisphaerae bacterium]
MASQPDTRDHRRHYTPAALFMIVLAASIPYWTARHCILFFDSLQLNEMPNAGDMGTAVSTLVRQFWIPGQNLSMLSIAFNHKINTLLGWPGFDPFLMVATNVAVHAFNSVLVFLLLRAILRGTGRSGAAEGIAPLAAALLFAAHPIHVTTVVYVVQRRTLITAMFYLLSLFCYLRIREPGRGHQQTAWIVALIVAGWLSVQSKTMGMTLPIAIAALEICLRVARGQRIQSALIAMGIVACLFAAASIGIVWRLGYLNVGTWSINTMPIVNAPFSWGFRDFAL